jgi:hypothetical protein
MEKVIVTMLMRAEAAAASREKRADRKQRAEESR